MSRKPKIFNPYVLFILDAYFNYFNYSVSCMIISLCSPYPTKASGLNIQSLNTVTDTTNIVIKLHLLLHRALYLFLITQSFKWNVKVCTYTPAGISPLLLSPSNPQTYTNHHALMILSIFCKSQHPR